MSRRRIKNRTSNRVSLSSQAESDGLELGVLRPPGRPERTQKRPRRIEYVQETLRPLVCLVFVAPFLLTYEISSIFGDQMSAKSGIDQWLRWLMDQFGAGHLVILPLVTAGVLLNWHHQVRDSWAINPKVLVGMLAESIVLGIILFFAGNAVAQMTAVNPSDTRLALADDQSTICLGTTITFIGCGVYEELVFRLLMLSGMIYFGKRMFSTKQILPMAILITSFAFAILHYDLVNPSGATFDFYGFVFRFSASVVFCFLFLFRGFGIAVGTHVIYDVMTQF